MGSSTFQYFAYGSVLSPTHAREWCESHGMDVAPFLAGKAARLDGYKLVFDVPSRFWQGRVANVVPAAEAATTVRNEGGFFPARSDVSAAISAMMLPPKPMEASSPNGVVKVG